MQVGYTTEIQLSEGTIFIIFKNDSDVIERNTHVKLKGREGWKNAGREGDCSNIKIVIFPFKICDKSKNTLLLQMLSQQRNSVFWHIRRKLPIPLVGLLLSYCDRLVLGWNSFKKSLI